MREWEAFSLRGSLAWTLFDAAGERVVATVFKNIHLPGTWSVDHDVVRAGVTKPCTTTFDSLYEAKVFAEALP